MKVRDRVQVTIKTRERIRQRTGEKEEGWEMARARETEQEQQP